MRYDGTDAEDPVVCADAHHWHRQRHPPRRTWTDDPISGRILANDHESSQRAPERSLNHKTNDIVIVKAWHWPCPCPGIVRIYVNKHESSKRWKPASQDQRLRFFACLLAFWLFAGLFLLAVGHTRQGLLLVNCDDLADGSSMIAYQQ
jgi:hypothetical protein